MILLIINGFPVICCITSVRMAIPPPVSRLDPLAFDCILDPHTGIVDITGTNPGICRHSSVLVHVVPVSIHNLPSGFHCSVRLSAQIVPVCSIPVPSITDISIRIKQIPVSVDTFPFIRRPASIRFLPPPADIILSPRSRLCHDRNQ